MMIMYISNSFQWNAVNDGGIPMTENNYTGEY